MRLKRQDELENVRRESIIDAAESVFFAKGYHGATIDEIVSIAEYSKKTIYTYIKSKEEMYDAVAERAYISFHKELESSIAGLDDPEQSLKSLSAAAMRFAEEQPGYTSVILNYNQRLTEPSAPETIRNMDAGLVGVMEKVIQDGIDKGVFRDIGAKAAAAYIVAVFVGLVDMLRNKAHYLEGDRAMGREEFTVKSLDMLINGLKR